MSRRAVWPIESPARRRSPSSRPSGGRSILRHEWGVLYQDAFFKWILECSPSRWEVDRTEEWIERTKTYGPPESSVNVGDDPDLYVARVLRTQVTALYLVIDHERLVIVKEFR